MVIRDAQIKALEECVLRASEDRLMEHARTYFPARLHDGLRQAVAAAVRSARGYGIDGQREICKYLNLLFLFGRHFDIDPDCSWAHFPVFRRWSGFTGKPCGTSPSEGLLGLPRRRP